MIKAETAFRESLKRSDSIINEERTKVIDYVNRQITQAINYGVFRCYVLEIEDVYVIDYIRAHGFVLENVVQDFTAFEQQRLTKISWLNCNPIR